MGITIYRLGGMMSDPSALIGNTIKHDIMRVERTTIESANAISSATLHEAADRTGALPAAIRAVTTGLSICGPALTVHMPGGDNLWLHKAIYIAQPGDVLVVYTSRVYDHGYWGEVMSTAARMRGIGGLVIDGYVRDADKLTGIGLPVFSRGFCIQGTGKDTDGLGWINAPILMGQTIVRPGDLVVGDADGVVAIPRDHAADVVLRAQERDRDEVDTIARLHEGHSTLEHYQF
ncbi:4-carboxy-4-hydroxy-2-oxoadipate aldolase/oxaloacetate decarboxylase [Eoetvoesiella caeni]|uniref:Putative 4-hydroxy-4-methyl-2-oxoglutarate aldolase n=2 Tax=Eoetvoesiella caeni TaxID=645616 RepID=A0A366H2D2_9BURK|nr:4-carboxy-4-hydroxy-2-oxoadipate aldolase/oxaloacetate decarboxylase [Eoetvoesiella caeni]MCI2810969.1 4-carboxy-4-hydroxy-2-oxoadipate aldolase/oxaloacetate decarboxylase [Eoetvoesiella caeni]RBP35435.1 4-hydroxy-4-methyl-2-oxoglutarate aldolase [Eoetvoesiella caeni]